jgi:hypothetical protein
MLTPRARPHQLFHILGDGVAPLSGRPGRVAHGVGPAAVTVKDFKVLEWLFIQKLVLRGPLELCNQVVVVPVEKWGGGEEEEQKKGMGNEERQREKRCTGRM